MPFNTTTQQLAVIGCLINGELSGRDLRAELEKRKAGMSRGAFYRLMSRTEEAKLVKGRFETKEIGGNPIKQRFYRVTGVGMRAWNEAMMQLGVQTGGGAVRMGGTS